MPLQGYANKVSFTMYIQFDEPIISYKVKVFYPRAVPMPIIANAVMMVSRFLRFSIERDGKVCKDYTSSFQASFDYSGNLYSMYGITIFILWRSLIEHLLWE